MNQSYYYDKFTNEIFVKYFSTFNPRLAAAKKLCNKFVSASDRVLEVGCGVGIIAKSLVRRVASYTGLDLSKIALNLAQILAPEGRFFQSNISAFQTGWDKTGYSKYDAIILIDVVEHLKNFHTDLQKLSTMLSDAGRIIIQCPTPEATAKNTTPQFVEKPVVIEAIILATGLRLAYLNYFGVEHENQYMQLVLTKQLPVDPIEPSKLISGLKSRWLRLKNRKILELLRNLSS